MHVKHMEYWCNLKKTITLNNWTFLLIYLVITFCAKFKFTPILFGSLILQLSV